MRIVDVDDERRSRRCSIARRGAIAALERRVARDRRATCARGGDRALLAIRARGSTASTAPFEVTRDGDATRGARRVAPDVRARHPRRRRATSARVARAAGAARRGDVRRSPGVTIEQRVAPLDRVGCYVPGGRYPLPSSLLMTAIPARVAGVREIIAVCPQPDPAVMAGGARGGRHAAASRSAARTRSPRWPTARRPIPRVDKIVGPGNAYVAAAKALVSRRLRHRLLRRPERDPDRRRRRDAPTWIAADLHRAGRARSGRARDSRHAEAGGSRARSPRKSRARCRPTGRRAPSLARNGAIIVDAHARRGDRAQRTAWRPSTSSATRDALAARLTPRRNGVRRPVQRAGRGRLRHRLEPRAADGGAARGRGGLTAADFVRVSTVQTLDRARAPPARRRTAIALARGRGAPRARRVDAAASEDEHHERDCSLEREHGVRLHRTRTVPAALRVSPSAVATARVPRSIPTTTRRNDAVARAASASPPIMCCSPTGSTRASSPQPRRRCATASRRGIPEALGVAPAFDMYEACVNAARRAHGDGAARTRVRLSVGRPARARSRRATRIVFVTNPHNPSGCAVRARASFARSRATSRPALLFVDEAYADFSGETLIDAGRLIVAAEPLVGRTFSKATALPAFAPARSSRIPRPCRRCAQVVPPYSLNA